MERALRTVGSWARAIVLLMILWLGATAAPVVLPILAPAQAVVYARRIGASRRAEEKTGLGALPEFLSHMCGWDEIVAAAARSFAQIPPEERGGAAILAPNYGVAAAIDVLGRRAGLPPALSGHNNYWIWGPRGQTGDPMIIIGRSEDEVRGWFEDVRRIGETDCGYCMPYENHQPIWIGRGLRRPLRSLWPSLQYYQ